RHPLRHRTRPDPPLAHRHGDAAPPVAWPNDFVLTPRTHAAGCQNGWYPQGPEAQPTKNACLPTPLSPRCRRQALRLGLEIWQKDFSLRAYLLAAWQTRPTHSLRQNGFLTL